MDISSIKSNDAQELNSTIRFLESLTKFDIHNAESLSKIAGKAIVDAVKKDNKILRKWVFKVNKFMLTKYGSKKDNCN